MNMTRSQIVMAWLARMSGVAALLFLMLPLLVLLPISMSDSNFFVLPQNGLSMRWYETVINSSQWRDAAWNSLVVATCSSLIALVLGTSAACGIAYLRGRVAAMAYSVMLIPLVMPVIVVALAVYISYNAWGLTDTRIGLITAHAALGIPFVVITVVASLKKYDTRLFSAAISLGANNARAFRHAVLPSIGPAVLAGAVYAFHASFDESIVVLFLARVDQATLPQRIFSGMTDNITPAVAVVAIMTTLATLLLLLSFLAAERMQNVSQRRLNPI